MDRIVEERDAAAKNASENFGDDQPERENHGPAEDGGLQRGMRVAAVNAGMACMVVVLSGVMSGAVVVGRPGHAPILRAQLGRRSHRTSLVGSLTTQKPEWY